MRCSEFITAEQDIADIKFEMEKALVAIATRMQNRAKNDRQRIKTADQKDRNKRLSYCYT